MKTSSRGKLLLLLLLTLLSALLGVGAGASFINVPAALGELFTGGPVSADARILLYVRLPRVCASLLSGAALAVAGL